MGSYATNKSKESLNLLSEQENTTKLIPNRQRFRVHEAEGILEVLYKNEQTLQNILRNRSRATYERVWPTGTSLRIHTAIKSLYGDKIELGEIAAAAFMSRFYYIRIFQQVYGMTPRQFLRDLRIEKAKELLKKGHSVTQVCFDIGYESLPTFSKVFKRGTGYSPKAYQELKH